MMCHFLLSNYTVLIYQGFLTPSLFFFFLSAGVGGGRRGGGVLREVQGLVSNLLFFPPSSLSLSLPLLSFTAWLPLTLDLFSTHPQVHMYEKPSVLNLKASLFVFNLRPTLTFNTFGYFHSVYSSSHSVRLEDNVLCL